MQYAKVRTNLFSNCWQKRQKLIFYCHPTGRPCWSTSCGHDKVKQSGPACPRHINVFRSVRPGTGCGSFDIIIEDDPITILNGEDIFFTVWKPHFDSEWHKVFTWFYIACLFIKSVWLYSAWRFCIFKYITYSHYIKSLYSFTLLEVFTWLFSLHMTLYGPTLLEVCVWLFSLHKVFAWLYFAWSLCTAVQHKRSLHGSALHEVCPWLDIT